MNAPVVYDGTCANLSDDMVGEYLLHRFPHVVRLRMPEQPLVLQDLIIGTIRLSARQLSDPILVRTNGHPTYHLASAVDDAAMRITHVLRANEAMTGAFIHAQILRYLDLTPVSYAHIPILLNEHGQKLSNRIGSPTLEDYRRTGFLPEAIIRHLASLLMAGLEDLAVPIDEIIDRFDISQIKRTNPKFSEDKLRWYNRRYIRDMPISDLAIYLESYMLAGLGDEDVLDRSRSESVAIADLLRPRLSTLADIKTLGSYLYVYDDALASSVFSAIARDDLEAKAVLIEISRKLEEIDDTAWTGELLDQILIEHAESLCVSKSTYFRILRVVLSGSESTPPIVPSMRILGRLECLRRVHLLLAVD